MPMPRANIAGQRFGRLTAIRWARRDGNGTFWLVRCDCGAEKTVQLSALRSSGTVSCGCGREEKASQRLTTHGLTGSAEFAVWQGVLGRAHTGSADCASLYKGRGITVCERWLIFENFLADMGPRPPGTSLDRINNDGDYEPGNCRWATPREQNRNKSTNRVIAAFGRAQPLIAWAEELGVSPQAIAWRLRAGWPVEKAVSQKGRFA